jgi:hypothetical protein
LRLPFSPLPEIADSICWQEGPPLHRLVDLPRGALSGPVQQDKAAAHATLVRLIEAEEQVVDSFDLRQIDGIQLSAPAQCPYASFEAFASCEQCRKVRIISYKDFVKTISLALPLFLGGERIKLRQASWRGPRIFWAGEHNSEAFACAVAYARRRELEIILPADITRYRLNSSAIEQLQQQYHALAMPSATWNDAAFMALLLENGLPYARLSLLRNPGDPEVLLLPKHSAHANALGEGLKLAGAPDVAGYLQRLNAPA